MSVVPVPLGESCTPRPRRPRRIGEQIVPKESVSAFGACVLVLAARAGEKPAEWLRARIGGTPRHANHIIRGRCYAPLAAVLAVVAEFR